MKHKFSELHSFQHTPVLISYHVSINHLWFVSVFPRYLNYVTFPDKPSVVQQSYQINRSIYRVIQEQRSLFWKVVLSVIVSKNILMKTVFF